MSLVGFFMSNKNWVLRFKVHLGEKMLGALGCFNRGEWVRIAKYYASREAYLWEFWSRKCSISIPMHDKKFLQKLKKWQKHLGNLHLSEILNFVFGNPLNIFNDIWLGLFTLSRQTQNNELKKWKSIIFWNL